MHIPLFAAAMWPGNKIQTGSHWRLIFIPGSSFDQEAASEGSKILDFFAFMGGIWPSELHFLVRPRKTQPLI